MVINLVRYLFLEDRTLGMIYIDGEFICHTLEDKVRDVKIYGETAIPKGQYKIIVDYSRHFRKKMPLLLDVPNFAGVRIHKGNYPKDTEGCLLVSKGLNTNNDLYNSKDAYNDLFKRIKRALSRNLYVFISIQDSTDIF